MKKILGLIFIACFLSSGFSQNISLSELFNFSNKSDWVAVNNKLLKEDWEYFESSKGDASHDNVIKWTYKRNYFGDPVQALITLYTHEGLPNKITYTFNNKSSYNMIKGGMTLYKMKQIDSEISDNEIEIKYANSSYILSIKTAKRVIEDAYFCNSTFPEYTVNVYKKASVNE